MLPNDALPFRGRAYRRTPARRHRRQSGPTVESYWPAKKAKKAKKGRDSRGNSDEFEPPLAKKAKQVPGELPSLSSRPREDSAVDR
jgi:hypothetical protein